MQTPSQSRNVFTSRDASRRRGISRSEMRSQTALVRAARIGKSHVSRFFGIVTAIALAGTVAVAQTTAGQPQASAPKASDQTSAMKIRIDIEGTIATATLIDSETTRDFVSLLPLTLQLKDYASTEKISDLPRKLSTKGAPPGVKPSIGDIAYYAPWGNLALFYKDFKYSSGLIKLGTIDSGMDVFNRPDPITIKITLAAR